MTRLGVCEIYSLLLYGSRESEWRHQDRHQAMSVTVPGFIPKKVVIKSWVWTWYGYVGKPIESRAKPATIVFSVVELPMQSGLGFS